MIIWNKKQVSLSNYIDLMKDELNIKEILFVDDLSKFQSTNIKLNFKSAGAAFGKLTNSIKKYLETMPNKEKNLLLENGQVQINVEGQNITLLNEHINIEHHIASDFDIAGDDQLKVLMNIKL